MFGNSFTALDPSKDLLSSKTGMCSTSRGSSSSHDRALVASCKAAVVLLNLIAAVTSLLVNHHVGVAENGVGSMTTMSVVTIF